jgi:hypothetical protein
VLHISALRRLSLPLAVPASISESPFRETTEYPSPDPVVSTSNPLFVLQNSILY